MVPMLLDRREAAEYLQTRHGLPITPEQLARLATNGGGPHFHLCGGRRSAAVYAPATLDAWAAVSYRRAPSVRRATSLRRGSMKEQRGVPWKPGQSGNPKGRPKGARNKLSDAFVEALFEDFCKHGAEAIEACRKDKPEAYLTVICRVLPKEVNLKADGSEAFLKIWEAIANGLASSDREQGVTEAEEFDQLTITKQ